MAGRKGQNSGGHNRKSAEQHRIDGTYRESLHGNRLELKVPPAKLPEPQELSGDGLAAWYRITESLPAESITNLDSDALLTYCRCWQMLCKVWPKFEADPIDKDTRIAAMALMDRCDKYGRQFGLTPQARMSLRLPADDDTAEDPFDSFLNRRSADQD